MQARPHLRTSLLCSRASCLRQTRSWRKQPNWRGRSPTRIRGRDAVIGEGWAHARKYFCPKSTRLGRTISRSRRASHPRIRTQGQPAAAAHRRGAAGSSRVAELRRRGRSIPSMRGWLAVPPTDRTANYGFIQASDRLDGLHRTGRGQLREVGDTHCNGARRVGTAPPTRVPQEGRQTASHVMVVPKVRSRRTRRPSAFSTRNLGREKATCQTCDRFYTRFRSPPRRCLHRSREGRCRLLRN